MNNTTGYKTPKKMNTTEDLEAPYAPLKTTQNELSDKDLFNPMILFPENNDHNNTEVIQKMPRLFSVSISRIIETDENGNKIPGMIINGEIHRGYNPSEQEFESLVESLTNRIH